ncbi:argininosuccinate synthase [Buchnera aphidicola (Mindarus keteleerifoliae)]|uniref:argininosuccinate synthase n=1 Tax=Buchnera aphidicola TaxID=9 RepID=UPI0031B6AA82
MKVNEVKTVVLAYSGGVDTSAIIPWIIEKYGYKVIAFVADVGQSREDLKGIEKKAMQSGAKKCYVFDLRKKFVENYVYPMVRMGAMYEWNYLLGTAIARPIIAKAQVDLATDLKAYALCHGATGKGNDQVRFEMAYAALAPNLKVISPWREWKFRSREELITYLNKKNIPVTATKKKIYSRDENLWHLSTEGGDLECPWNKAKEDCWIWTIDPKLAPEIPEKLSVLVKEGNVVQVNGKNLTPVECLNLLNKIASRHGIGRVDMVENRLVGIKSRGCYETPGGTLMMHSIRAVEELVLDNDCFKWKQKLSLKMASIIYEGKWFTPLRKSLQEANNVLSKDVTGEVVLELYKGTVRVLQKKSINSLYSIEYATFGKDQVYDQTDAKGFINLYSLSSKIRMIKKSFNKKS